MATLGSLIIELAADVGKLQTDMRRAVSVVDAGVGKMRSAAQLASKALAGLGVGLSVAGLAGFVRQGIELADSMGKAAQRAGVTTEAFTQLNYAAELADVSTSTLETSLGILGRNAAEAARGSETSAKAFERIGVAVTNADGSLRDVDQIFLDVADSLAKLPTGAQQTASAMDLLGRGGRQLLPVLTEGRAGLEAFGAEARRLGIVISSDTAAAADAFGDQLDKMKIAARGLAITVGTDLLPAMTFVVDKTREAYEQYGALFSILVAIGAVAASPFLEFGKSADELKEKAANLRKEIATLQEEIDNVGSGRGAATALPAKRQQLQEYQAELARTIRAQLALIKDDKPKSGKPAAIVDEKAAEAARKAAERLAEAESSYVAGLEKRIALQQDSTELAAVLADIESGAAKEFSTATQERIRQLAAEYDLLQDTAEVREYLAGIERQRRQEAARAGSQAAGDRQRLIESLRTPEEAYAAEVRSLLALNLDDDTLQRGIAKAVDGLEAARKKAEDTKTTFADLGATFSSAFEDAIFAGKQLSDVLAGLGQDLARLLLRKTVTDPLADFFDKGGGSKLLSAGGDLLKGLFKNDRGGLYKVAGSGSSERPVAFTARAGEIVAVGTGTEAAGSGGVSINVHNYSGEQVRTEQNGTRQIDVFVGSAVTRATARGMMAPLGIRPPLVAR